MRLLKEMRKPMKIVWGAETEQPEAKGEPSEAKTEPEKTQPGTGFTERLGRYCAGRYKLRLAAVVCAALGWWGILYPELTLTSDTYKVVYEEEPAEEGSVSPGGQYQENDGITEGYRGLLRAKSNQIRIRSRLYLTITEWLGGEEKADSDEIPDEISGKVSDELPEEHRIPSLLKDWDRE